MMRRSIALIAIFIPFLMTALNDSFNADRLFGQSYVHAAIYTDLDMSQVLEYLSFDENRFRFTSTSYPTQEIHFKTFNPNLREIIQFDPCLIAPRNGYISSPNSTGVCTFGVVNSVGNSRSGSFAATHDISASFSSSLLSYTKIIVMQAFEGVTYNFSRTIVDGDHHYFLHTLFRSKSRTYELVGLTNRLNVDIGFSVEFQYHDDDVNDPDSGRDFLILRLYYRPTPSSLTTALPWTLLDYEHLGPLQYPPVEPNEPSFHFINDFRVMILNERIASIYTSYDRAISPHPNLQQNLIPNAGAEFPYYNPFVSDNSHFHIQAPDHDEHHDDVRRYVSITSDNPIEGSYSYFFNGTDQFQIELKNGVYDLDLPYVFRFTVLASRATQMRIVRIEKTYSNYLYPERDGYKMTTPFSGFIPANPFSIALHIPRLSSQNMILKFELPDNYRFDYDNLQNNTQELLTLKIDSLIIARLQSVNMSNFYSIGHGALPTYNVFWMNSIIPDRGHSLAFQSSKVLPASEASTSSIPDYLLPCAILGSFRYTDTSLSILISLRMTDVSSNSTIFSIGSNFSLQYLYLPSQRQMTFDLFYDRMPLIGTDHNITIEALSEFLLISVELNSNYVSLTVGEEFVSQSMERADRILPILGGKIALGCDGDLLLDRVRPRVAADMVIDDFVITSESFTKATIDQSSVYYRQRIRESCPGVRPSIHFVCVNRAWTTFQPLTVPNNSTVSFGGTTIVVGPVLVNPESRIVIQTLLSVDGNVVLTGGSSVSLGTSSSIVVNGHVEFNGTLFINGTKYHGSIVVVTYTNHTGKFNSIKINDKCREAIATYTKSQLIVQFKTRPECEGIPSLIVLFGIIVAIVFLVPQVRAVVLPFRDRR